MPSTTTIIRELDDGNSQGTRLGRNADALIAFYGATPAARLGGGFAVSTASVSTVIATSATGGGAVTVDASTWGFSSAAQGNAMVTGVNALITDVARLRGLYERLRGHLVSTGLFTGS